MTKKSFDRQLRSISAFGNWKELVLSCKYHGYVPTLKVEFGHHTNKEERDAVRRVRRFLDRCGYKVYPKFGEYNSDVCDTWD